MDDYRGSTTLVCMGNAARNLGPWIFLLKGTRVNSQPLRNLEDMGCPKFSCVQPKPSAHMTDDTWLKIVPIIYKGIRAMPVVKDHPNWWFCLTLDGFLSHVVTEAESVFTYHRIHVIQEDSDPLQINQPYDQYAM